MGSEIQADDGMLMLLFMQGLREGMREKILPFGPVSFQECKDKAILIASSLPPTYTAPWKRNTAYRTTGNRQFSSSTNVPAASTGTPIKNISAPPPKAQNVNTPRGGSGNGSYKGNYYNSNYRANYNPSSNDARGRVFGSVYRPSPQSSYSNSNRNPNPRFQSVQPNNKHCSYCNRNGHLQSECRTKVYHQSNHNQQNRTGNF